VINGSLTRHRWQANWRLTNRLLANHWRLTDGRGQLRVRGAYAHNDEGKRTTTSCGPV